MTNPVDGTQVFEDWVTVLTRLPSVPLPPNSQRKPFETERLIIRRPIEEDLEALHELRTQPEVMINTMRALVDDDLEYTRGRLTPFLTPGDANTFNMVICLKEAGDNRLIGIGGVHRFHSGFGWPEMGYMFSKHHWGKGYATEFVRAFVQLYAQLPRPETPQPLRVTRSSLSPEDAAKAGPGTKEKGEEFENDPAALAATVTADTVVVKDFLSATVPEDNLGSQGVIRKGGFQKFFKYHEDDTRYPGTGIQITLDVLKWFPGRKTQTEPNAEV